MWRVKLQLTSFVVDRGRVEGEEIRFVHGPIWQCSRDAVLTWATIHQLTIKDSKGDGKTMQDFTLQIPVRLCFILGHTRSSYLEHMEWKDSSGADRPAKSKDCDIITELGSISA